MVRRQVRYSVPHGEGAQSRGSSEEDSTRSRTDGQGRPGARGEAPQDDGDAQEEIASSRPTSARTHSSRPIVSFGRSGSDGRRFRGYPLARTGGVSWNS